MTAEAVVRTDPTAASAGPATWVEALLAERPRARQIEHLCDTRVLHRLLARASHERKPHGAIGRYRKLDEPVFVLVNVRPEAPMVSTTCPPARVAQEMAMLGNRIRSLLTDPPAPEQQRKELAAILATFFRIHPYRDGNGRIARILFRRAARLLELPLTERWSLDTSGYGAAMSLAVESYHLSPRPLEFVLNRYFAGPDGPAAAA
ncbi:MAG: Fic family protein [Rhodobacter sp.]|nr:Fic family protein [Rhodobacter sp.]